MQFVFIEHDFFGYWRKVWFHHNTANMKVDFPLPAEGLRLRVRSHAKGIAPRLQHIKQMFIEGQGCEEIFQILMPA